MHLQKLVDIKMYHFIFMRYSVLQRTDDGDFRTPYLHNKTSYPDNIIMPEFVLMALISAVICFIQIWLRAQRFDDRCLLHAGET